MDIGWIEGALGVAGIAGGAFAIFRAEGLRASVAIFKDTNEELRAKIDDEQEKRHEGEVRCAEQIANLTGQLEAIQSEQMRTFMGQLHLAVIDLLERDLADVLSSPRG